MNYYRLLQQGKFRKKVLFLLAFMMIMLSPAISTGQSGTTTAGVDTVIVERLRPIILTEVTNEAEKATVVFNKIVEDLKPSKAIHLIDSLLPDYITYLKSEAREINEERIQRTTRMMLESLYREWESYNTRLDASKGKLDSRSTQLNGIIEELDEILVVWILTRESLETEEETPVELKDRVESIIKSAEDLNAQATKRRGEVVVLEDKITEQKLMIDKNLNTISHAQTQFRKNLFVKDSPYLWQVSIDSISLASLKESFKDTVREDVRNLDMYFTLKPNTWYRYLAVLLLSIILMLVLRLRFHKLNLSQNDYMTAMARHVISQPVITGFVFSFLLFYLFFPSRPVVLNEIIMIVALLTITLLLRRIADRPALPFLLFLVFLYMVDQLRAFFYTEDVLNRYYLLIEALVAFVVFFWYFGKKTVRAIKVNTLWAQKLLRFTARLLHLVIGISIFANIFGYVSLAAVLLGVTVTGLVTAIVIYGSVIVLETFTIILVRLREARLGYIAKQSIQKVEKRLIQIINLVAVLVWLRSVLEYIDLFRPLLDWLDGLMEITWSIGESEISLAGLFGFVITIIITFVVAGLVKLILEEEIFTRIKMKKGLPEAISMLLRFAIVTFGIIVALMAGGLDLSKFGLLAGALGVGIGFGLQTIIYNFVSGLILVFERPIKIGDTVEVENLVGIVKRIGIRSSNVRTYDGAEVIVPNGNLIANQVINWTLSDEKRRLDVRVGAAYGTDPSEVLKRLRKVAENHPNVIQEPKPMTLFDGFGESSLDFRLLVWAHYEVGLSTRSDLSIAIYNEFAKANITIPFPQRDVHIKEKPGTGNQIQDKWPEANDEPGKPAHDKKLPGKETEEE